VTRIGGNAFEGCTGLSSISVSEGNKYYDSRDNCNAIIEIETNKLIQGCASTHIPNSVTEIDCYAFSGCTGLTSIVIPDSVTKIGFDAFFGCTGLMSICVSAGNKTYNSCDNCNAIIETETNKLIQGCASTLIPNSVTSIGSRAFYGCAGLTSIVIPNSVTSIENSAFHGCAGLMSIVIPDSVTKIFNRVFEGCTGLTSISVSAGNECYDSRDNCNAIIETKTNVLIHGFATTLIPNSVTKIGEFAFYNCTRLTEISIPNSVTEIGKYAFSGCTGLTSIVVPGSVIEIGERVFEGCTGLTSINIPDSVTKIWGSAFNGCTGLTSIVIPDSVTKIGDYAFSDCTSLTSIVIPSSVTRIGWVPFNRCNSMESIYCHVADPAQIDMDRGVELGGHQATLYVPAGKGVVAAYKKKAVWKKFAAIKPMEEKYYNDYGTEIYPDRHRL
jgi:hypothetical protein